VLRALLNKRERERLLEVFDACEYFRVIATQKNEWTAFVRQPVPVRKMSINMRSLSIQSRL